MNNKAKFKKNKQPDTLSIFCSQMLLWRLDRESHHFFTEHSFVVCLFVQLVHTKQLLYMMLLVNIRDEKLYIVKTHRKTFKITFLKLLLYMFLNIKFNFENKNAFTAVPLIN